MRIYKNISLLDVSNAKLMAIAAYRKKFGTSVLDSKQAIETILENGFIEIDECSSDLIIEELIHDYFKYDLELVAKEPKVDMPDAETQEALNWYADCDVIERFYIEKIIAWEKRGMMYPARG